MRLCSGTPARPGAGDPDLLFHGHDHGTGAAVSVSALFHLCETWARELDSCRGFDLHGDVFSIRDLPAADLRTVDPLCARGSGASRWRSALADILPCRPADDAARIVDGCDHRGAECL